MEHLDLDFINEIEEKIRSIYSTEDLKSLSGTNSDYIVNGKQIFQWYCQIVEKSKKLNPDFNFQKCFDDLCICSDEVIYFMAYLYLYKPYINNPTDKPICINGKTIYCNYQNIPSKRYFMFVNIVYEKMYNYWDKIGDFLGANFPQSIKPKNVYFKTALDVVNDYCKKSESLDWLNNFYSNEYTELNKARQNAVHYSGADTEYKWEYINNFTNYAELTKSHSNYLAIPDKLKIFLENMKIGLFHVLHTIENYHIERS